MQDHAQARLQVESAKARALYWLSTRPIGLASSGFADEVPLGLDGRLYRMKDGTLLSLQDVRGLISLNVPTRERFLAMLIGAGASFDQASSMFDIVLDYADTDNLRRLNGAEAPDYAAAELPPPRNDWMTSTDETARMPVWASQAELRARVQPWLSVSRDNELLNPNTLRRRAPFVDAAAAVAATGIAFPGDESLLFHASNALRLQLWAPGLPTALEYNLLILPTGDDAPWLIHEVRQSNRLVIPDAQQAAAKFPDASKAFARPQPSAMPDP